MDGILIVDKPEVYTSHDVVARLRGILKTKRIGHTGTLDPFATGVLVMLVNKATRLAQFLDKDVKEYEAVVRCGFETDTGDRTGRQKVKGKRQKVEVEEIEAVLKDFRGEIEQMPPMYSAKKIAGKKLYELARKGVEIERQPAKVTIYELELIKAPKVVNIEFDELNTPAESSENQCFEFKIKVACSAGTYIRTLAEDIGKKLETGAHLAELRRMKAGKFDLSKAVSIEELEKILAENRLADFLISMNDAIAHLPLVILSEAEIADTRNGKRLRFETDALENNQLMRMIDAAQNLIAVGFYLKSEKSVQPKLVLV